MGRRSLFASVAAAAAVAPSTASSIAGVDVLARAESLVVATPAAAPSSASTFLPLATKDLPTDVAATLASKALTWDALSDVMRIGVLWAHGYVVPGGSNGGKKLVKVWTACAAGHAMDERVGQSMSDIALSATAFTAAQCEKNTCGNFFQATNSKCTNGLPSQLVCAVDATNLPPSTESFWSNAGSDSTAVPYPQVYTHALSVSNQTLNLVSIHMAATSSGGVQCGNTGDAIVPCVALADVTKAQSFCRPQVNAARIESFLNVVAEHLAESTTITTKSDGSSKSSGLSTGAIAGIIGGAVVVLGLLAFYFFRTKKARQHAANDPEYPGFGRKSSPGPIGGTNGGNNPPAGFGANRTKQIHRQGTSNTFPLIDSSRDNDTVFSSDYVGGDNNLDEDSRQRPFSRRLLQSQESLRSMTRSRSRNSSMGMFGKSVDDYCEESEVIRDFVNDPQIKIRRIPYEELTVLRILSKGSYGEVFLGQLETRHVAMKRLLPEKKHLTRSIEQFMGEIQIMCNLEHRNIVTFVGVSWDYLQNIAVVVEYMDNGDLAEVLAKSKTKYTWPKEKISISMDIAEGLVYLHSMRPVIIHRDLKSKNVLLNKRGQAKLSDFGVSRKTTVNETMTSGVGTLLWTAPEIIEGRKYSEKADIFSLGVVLSEIDTCEEPYSTVKNEETGERLPGMQIVQMVRLGELRVNFRDDCPPKLRELAQQCTDLDPDKRPTSMEVAYTLKSIIAPSLRTL